MRKIIFLFMTFGILLNAQNESIADALFINEGDTILNSLKESAVVEVWGSYLDWFNFPSFLIGLGFGFSLFLYSLYQRKSIKYIIPESKTRKKEDKIGEAWGSFFKTFNEQDDAQKLYDSLRRKIHPDRFPNDEVKRDIASKLASELGDEKLHLDRLKEIEKIAKQKGLIN